MLTPLRSLNHRRYAVNDETLYVAPSDKRTDYSQPPMSNFYYGVLNTGRRRYAHPALTGSLPFPWLPATATPKRFGDGAAQRRGVVLSLRRKMAKKLRRSQAQSSESEAEGRGIPEGWTTGDTLSRATSAPSRQASGSTEAGQAPDSTAEDGSKLGTSISSVSNPWRDPTPPPSGPGPSSKIKKRMSFDPASGIIALPDEDNIWGDAGNSTDSEDEGEEAEEEGGDVPESPVSVAPLLLRDTADSRIVDVLSSSREKADHLQYV